MTYPPSLRRSVSDEAIHAAAPGVSWIARFARNDDCFRRWTSNTIPTCPLNSSNSSAPIHRGRSARTAGARAWRWRTRGSSRNHPLALHRERRDRAVQVRKGAGAARRRKRGRRFLDDRQLSRRHLSGPAVAVRRRRRTGHGALSQRWGDMVISGMFPMILADIPQRPRAGGLSLFRKSREARFNRTLEEIFRGRDERSTDFGRTLDPSG